jgi:SecY interacting protein Syd
MSHEAILNLAERYTEQYPDGLIVSPRFTEASSFCEVSRDQERIRWRPQPQIPKVNFERIEAALELPIHNSIKDFYQSLWCGPLHLTFEDAPVDLIQLWNEADFEHLIENIFGHYLQKKRFKQAFTFFFATGDESSEAIYSVENETGRVVMEIPGPKSVQIRVAEDLSEFLNQLNCRACGELSA